MSHTLGELQSLGSALGLDLVDELSTYRERLDEVKSRPEAQQIALVMPMLQHLLDAAEREHRTSVYGWCLSGRVDGVRVTVRPLSHAAAGGGGAGHTETAVEALFEPPLQLGLKITYEALVLRLIQKVTGRHDLQTGNAELDGIVHVQAADAEAAAALLADAAVQQVLLDAYKKSPFPLVTDKSAVIEHYGFETDVDKLRGSLATVTAIVKSLGRKNRQ